MIFRKLVVYAFITFFAASGHAVETSQKIQDMVDDLGGAEKQPFPDNGRTQQCAWGGTKRITVFYNGKETTYSAVYSNCRDDRVRDAIYEIKMIGSTVVYDRELPTVNGELFDAVMADDTGKVRRLIKAKADVNFADRMPLAGGGHVDGWTPLMSAASNGNLDIVRLLVKSGALVNAENSESKNALWLAAHYDRADVVKFLAGQGAKIDNAATNGMTPLMGASINGNSRIVATLIQHRADVNLVHADWDTALMFAVAKNRIKVARQLIDAGADVNISNRFGVSALIIAVVENRPETVRMLLAKGADPAARTDFNKSALDIAREKKFDEIVKLLSAVQGKTTVK